MKKIVICMMSAMFLLASVPSVVKAEELPKKKTPVAATYSAVEAKIKELESRLEEIKAMDKTEMEKAEKKELRKEVRMIKKEIASNGGGVYLSVGAVIIIVLLLVILL